MAMANPQPPPHTSFQESPVNAGSESFTGAGDSIGDFSGEAPGRYPHTYTIFSARSSSSTTNTFASSTASFSLMATKKKNSDLKIDKTKLQNGEGIVARSSEKKNETTRTMPRLGVEAKKQEAEKNRKGLKSEV